MKNRCAGKRTYQSNKSIPPTFAASKPEFFKSTNMEYRTEKDTMGEVKVPATALYGAQTQRSIDNFQIAQDINRMPKEIITAFAYLKKAAAITKRKQVYWLRKRLSSSRKSATKSWKENWMNIFPW